MSKKFELAIPSLLLVLGLEMLGISPEVIELTIVALLITATSVVFVVVSVHWEQADRFERDAEAISPSCYRAHSSWWTVLKVSPHATSDEIKTAYRRAVKETHPDALPQGIGNVEVFYKVRAAYQEAMQQSSHGVLQ